MKKIYLLGFALCAFAFSATAQIELEDNIDSYSLGDISPQATHWRTWGSSPDENGEVTDENSFSGANSMKIGTGVGPQDQLLLITSFPQSGIYTVRFKLFVPTGNEAYFNMQGEISGPPQVQALIGGNVFFNQDGDNPGQGLVDGTATPDTFSFTHDTWMEITCEYDIDGQVWDMDIDGTEVVTDHPFEFNGETFNSLGGLDFFAASTATTFYLDDVLLSSGVLGVDDFSADVFSVYPNPVKDKLNIESAAAVNSVTVYDVLGKKVLSAQPDAISPSIDMSGLSSGAYLVQVTIGSATKTVKVLK